MSFLCKTSLLATTFLTTIVFASQAPAGIVTTLDGKTTVGHIAFKEPSTIIITSDDKVATSVSLDDVSEIDLSPRSQEPLIGSDVGATLFPGSVSPVESNAGKLQLGASGWGIWSSSDSFTFAHRAIVGDGQIVTHVNMPADRPKMSVGVMFRNSLDPNSDFAAHLLTTMPANRLASRPWHDIDPGPVDAGAAPVSSWLRITRAGDVITALGSKDGHYWSEIGRHTVKLNGSILAGVFGFTAMNAESAAVKLDGTWVGVGDASAIAPPQTPLPASGVVLVDGSILTGNVTHLSNDRVEIVDTGAATKAFLRKDVAWIIFSPSCPDLSNPTATSGTFVVKTAGDVFEGELSEISDENITVDSILFGSNRFEIRKDLAAVALRRPRVWGPWFVRSMDGILHTAAALTVNRGHVIVGSASIPVGEIKEIFQIHANGRISERLSQP